MNKKTIGILFGGMSAEYHISLQSAHAVITHLNTERIEPVLIGVNRLGHWFRYHGSVDHILDDTWCNPKYCTPAVISPCRKNAGLIEYGTKGTAFSRLDAAFPIMHGPFGEDGTVQGLIELAGIPLVGCGTLASASCMDKDMAHRLAASVGIAVPKSASFDSTVPFVEIEKAVETLSYPLFVKPVRAGSSFGVSKVMTKDDISEAVQEAFRYDTRILLEKCIEGFEVGCAVMGNEDLLVGELDEVELTGGFFDYTEKYNLVTSRIHVPARLSFDKTEEVKETAKAIYRALGCKGFARVDMFVTPENRVLFNEVNTIPGFTAHSRFPSMMKAAGMSFEMVIERLIETAVVS